MLMEEFDRINTIQIGIWTRSSGAIRIFGTQSAHSSNYKHEKTRRGTGQVESTNDHGGR